MRKCYSSKTIVSFPLPPPGVADTSSSDTITNQYQSLVPATASSVPHQLPPKAQSTPEFALAFLQTTALFPHPHPPPSQFANPPTHRRHRQQQQPQYQHLCSTSFPPAPPRPIASPLSPPSPRHITHPPICPDGMIPAAAPTATSTLSSYTKVQERDQQRSASATHPFRPALPRPCLIEPSIALVPAYTRSANQNSPATSPPAAHTPGPAANVRPVRACFTLRLKNTAQQHGVRAGKAATTGSGIV
ncbi:hypothetical protein GALMADRAFT_160639 [Galerina marginata CBS 339.88]|uniref:Uncharacterized protein n=1 Tax=Galerina marginata (strain CBS 339.88) TaxID=685588 RepID=A0A067SMV4_GALM3|nr:hypothetical protein GALMADRAFT_160639 [Galerina marginata CBS 339.88]